jgi:hypothetical protein
MEDVIDFYYNGAVQYVEYWAEDGHRSDLADYRYDPLEVLIAEEEDREYQ